MVSFQYGHYTYTFDPNVVPELLSEMWAREPVGSLSITIAVTSLLITLTFKLLDYWWDMRKERARQGKLHIELSAAIDGQGRPALVAYLSNAGKEPVVVRDIGYSRRRLLGNEFVPLHLADQRLPHALNARDLIKLSVPVDGDASRLMQHFQVKDSLGKLWEPTEAEIRKFRRQLKALQARHRQQKPLTPEKTPLPDPESHPA